MAGEVWDFSPSTLDAYYTKVTAYLDEYIVSFQGRREKFKIPAFGIRSVTMLAAAVGVLAPLLVGKGKLLFPAAPGVEVGYIAFAFGALALLADQVFACSSSWSRLRLSELQMVGLRNDLEFEWAKQRPLLDAAEDDVAVAHGLLDLLKDAKGKAHLVNESQMKSWTSELSEGRAALAVKVGRP